VRRAARGLGRGVFDTLLPPLCPGCRAELRGRRWICGACRRRFEPLPAVAICFRCRAAERPDGNRRAGFTCAAAEHRAALGRAAFWMEEPLDRLVHALKYGGRRDLAAPLAGLLASAIPPPEQALAAAVPLHRARRRERGYNQAALLGREVCRRWGVPWTEDILTRIRRTPPQARTAESRRAANVAGAFASPAPETIRDRVWILFDDVATTGSTLVEAAGALEAAGASRVVPVALCLA
jgi:ComF family protein